MYSNNSNINNNYEYQQKNLNTIDDKYKYLENPFTNPEMPKNAEEERRAKMIEKITQNRKSKYNSHSVDKIKYKKSIDIQKRANYLGNHLFGEENKF